MKCYRRHPQTLYPACHKAFATLSREGGEYAGFVYAGKTPDGLLKIGSTRNCPICRMRHQELKLEGVQFSDDRLELERRVCRAIGPASRGREWFTEPSLRFEYLVSVGLLYRLDDLESRLTQCESENSKC